jgi:hypothetical protein
MDIQDVGILDVDSGECGNEPSGCVKCGEFY